MARGRTETPDQGEVVWLPQGCKTLGFNEAESGAQSRNQERQGVQADMNGMSEMGGCRRAIEPWRASP